MRRLISTMSLAMIGAGLTYTGGRSASTGKASSAYRRRKIAKDVGPLTPRGQWYANNIPFESADN